jgi:hypothetical protein
VGRAGCSSLPQQPGEQPAQFGKMQMLWQTPVYRVNARSFVGRFEEFNGKLLAVAQAQFDLFDESNPGLPQAGHVPNGINQVSSNQKKRRREK